MNRNIENLFRAATALEHAIETGDLDTAACLAAAYDELRLAATRAEWLEYCDRSESTDWHTAADFFPVWEPTDTREPFATCY